MDGHSVINDETLVAVPVRGFDKENCYAVLIGVGGKDIEFTENDARLLQGVLIDHCGYPPLNVWALTEREATRDKILDKLEELGRKVKPDSTVIVFFSGHGATVTARSGASNYYILPFLYDLSATERTCITREQLLTALNAIPASNLLLLLNCCHAGGIARVPAGILATAEQVDPKAVRHLRPQTNYQYLSATHGSSLAYDVRLARSWLSTVKDFVRQMFGNGSTHIRELHGNYFSAFTAALLEAFSCVGHDLPEPLRVGDIATHVCARVPQFVQGRYPPQVPCQDRDGANFEVTACSAHPGVSIRGVQSPDLLSVLTVERKPGEFLRRRKLSLKIAITVSSLCAVALLFVFVPKVLQPLPVVTVQVPDHTDEPLITVTGTLRAERGKLPPDLHLFAYVRNPNSPWRLASSGEDMPGSGAWTIDRIPLRIPGDIQNTAELAVVASGKRPDDPVDPTKYAHSPLKKVSFPAPQITVTQICDYKLAETHAPVAECPSLSASGIASGLLWDYELVCVRIATNGTVLPDTVASIPNANGNPREWVLPHGVEVRTGNITVAPSIVPGSAGSECEFASQSSFRPESISVAYK